MDAHDSTTEYAKYTTIEDVLNGGYGKTNIRILGTLERIEKQNRLISLQSHGQSIECEIPESYLSMLTMGMYVQVYGTVLLGSVKPRVIGKIVRVMNGIDEKAYFFAVDAFRKNM